MASAALDQDSLFSLELVVDTLSVPNITCRFPAIAFRLLDFPTLIVYHVEPDLGETIKSKIAVASNYEVPPQLRELQDKEGNFQVKKGKSCLFKASPDLLQSLLSSTPLYVMLIDTYPETPRLIGNCTVPLDVTMDDVYDDICKLGVSIPSVHGAKGTYKLYNLMSSNVGSVSLGYRLLSLGMGLIPHIPDRAIVKLKANGTSPKPTSGLFSENQDVLSRVSKDGLILEDLETCDKTLQVAITVPEPPKKERHAMSNQTEKEAVGTRATQTSRGKDHKKKTNRQRRTELPRQNEFDEIYITNIVCPPPLFYNSEAPEKSEQSMEFYANIPDAKGLHENVESDDEWLSDDDTIRPEDKFSDSDNEATVPKEENVAKKKSPVSKSNIAKSYANVQHQFAGLMKARPGQTFPILNALMKEIVSLQSGVVQPAALPSSKPTSPRMGSPRLQRALMAEKYHEDTLKKLATSRHARCGEAKPTSPERHSHRVCATGPPVVPKTKSWIRQTPSLQTFAVKKNKILPGMTNTQRLRLAKTNPALLQTLEKQEQERLEKWRRMRQKQGKDLGPTAEVFQGLNSQDITTEVSKHMLNGMETFGSVDDFASTAENIAHMDLGESEDFSHHKRPVPTPRHSVTKDKIVPLVRPRNSRAKKERRPVKKEQSTVVKVHSPSLEKVFLMPADDKEEDKGSFKSSSHSAQIEVHVPSVSLPDDDHGSDATSILDFDQELQGMNKDFGRTKTLHNPGFPATMPSTDYSDDFEAQTGRTTEPELRRVLENYPDHESEQADMEGEVPDLRMVVDKYSDDDADKDSEASRSFHSALSHETQQSAVNMVKKAVNTLLNPPSSVMSPTTMSKAPTLASGTREPFAASSTTVDDAEYSIAEDLGPGHLTKAERSIDAPKGLDSQISVTADSVSSYMPSEGEHLPQPRPPTAGEYSDEFEDISEEFIPEPRYMKDLKVDPKAKMGYTWSGQY